jgi:hypothetical protein
MPTTDERGCKKSVHAERFITVEVVAFPNSWTISVIHDLILVGELENKMKMNRSGRHDSPTKWFTFR